MNMHTKPQIGEWGVDLSIRDTEIDPGEDFFRHVTGRWLEQTEIPDDKVRLGAMNSILERTREQISSLIHIKSQEQFEHGSNAQKIVDLYTSFMNEETIEAAGLDPLKDRLAAVAALSSPKHLHLYFSEAVYRREFSPVAWGIDADPRDPSRQMITVTQGRLGLPNRDYYINDTPNFVAIRAHYRDYVRDMLSYVPEIVADPIETADAILRLETAIATAHWPEEERRDLDKTCNGYSLADLAREFGQVDWEAFFVAGHVTRAEECIVQTPSAISTILDQIETVDIAVWRGLITFRLLHDHADHLPAAIAELAFAFRGPVLSGQSQQPPRWERAIDLINASLGEAMGQVYVETYFDADAKAQIDDLVTNLLKALGQRLEACDWLSAETKAAALRKLDTFLPMIGYPDEWTDYSDVEIRSDDLFGNLARITAFEAERKIEGLNRPTDRNRWYMPPQTVNAYYHPLFNQIVFPAAILQPPFFDPNADLAVNYGGIGAIIGHEIGHGFDDQGRKFDENGQLNNWWTDEDVANYSQLSSILVDQYGSYEALPGEYVNGQQTLGENLGDLGGITLAYCAYRMALGDEEAPILDGLTGDQRFFLSFGQIWKSKQREEFTLQMLKSGVHSPAEFRVNGTLRNLDAWYDAFSISSESPWFVPEKSRAKLW